MKYKFIFKMTHIALFASGTGSNARAILQYFSNSTTVKVSVILTNNPRAGVLEIAEAYGIHAVILDRNNFYNSDSINGVLKSLYSVDYCILAGFLWKLPPSLIDFFPNAIINIHPSLLPKYGGLGMYGMHVHKAVIANHEETSGITIHFVDQNYDTGEIIAQYECPVLPTDTPESLAAKINVLELAHFSKVIELVINA